MPTCKNCGGYLTENYIRVFAPPELETSGACPHCREGVRAVDGERVARTSRMDRS